MWNGALMRRSTHAEPGVDVFTQLFHRDAKDFQHTNSEVAGAMFGIEQCQQVMLGPDLAIPTRTRLPPGEFGDPSCAVSPLCTGVIGGHAVHRAPLRQQWTRQLPVSPPIGAVNSPGL